MWRPRHPTFVHIKTQTCAWHTQRHRLTHRFISSRQSVAKKKLLILGWQALKALQKKMGLIRDFFDVQYVCVDSCCVDECKCVWLVIFGNMWGTLTISVCTLWLGLFWTQGGWWSPQPSHPAGGDRWRVVVHHQPHTELNVIHTDIPILFRSLVKHMKIAYAVYICSLHPLTGKEETWDMTVFALKLACVNTHQHIYKWFFLFDVHIF